MSQIIRWENNAIFRSILRKKDYNRFPHLSVMPILNIKLMRLYVEMTS